MVLPEEYKEHMKELLGGEYESFISIYDDDRERSYGLRKNLLKYNSDDFDKIIGLKLEKVSWASEGYYYDPAERPGKNALHEAGAYYIQEPSAMCAVPLLDPKPGEFVCDPCAAPGGKSTQIAGRMGRLGLLVSNEIIKNRADILSSNIERMGVSNCVVTNEDPKTMAAMFSCFFDKVLVDAPCSGEGMFRKEENAVSEWSIDNVHMCAERQRMILDCASKMVRPGGSIVYSTCTFEPEEDEQAAADFIKSHPDWKIVSDSVRIWPHHARGEGHFAVRFVKDGVLTERTDIYGDINRDVHGDINGDVQKKNQQDFGRNVNRIYACKKKKEVRGKVPAANRACMILNDVCTKNATDEIRSNHIFTDFGGNIYAVPAGMTDMSGLSVKRPGLQIVMTDDKGKNTRLMPAHALAMYLRPDEAKKSYDMNDIEAVRFLNGESLQADIERLKAGLSGSCSDGWILMTYRGFSTGWGKKTGNIIKNHYPKGLRRDVSKI